MNYTELFEEGSVNDGKEAIYDLIFTFFPTGLLVSSYLILSNFYYLELVLFFRSNIKFITGVWS